MKGKRTMKKDYVDFKLIREQVGKWVFEVI
jgi:hypothetical protein